MPTNDALAIWEFPSTATYDEMGTIAMDAIEEPDARGGSSRTAVT